MTTNLAFLAASLDEPFSMLAALAAVLSLAILVFQVVTDKKRENEQWRREEAERELWRDPIDFLEYLLPQAEYRLRTFPDGPAEERTQPALTVGLGEYLIGIRFFTKTEIHADDVIWSWGDLAGAVIDFGEVNPYMIDPKTALDGGINYTSWWGEGGHKSPDQVFQPNIAWVRFRKIRTVNPHSGSLEIIFRMRGHGVATRSLPFAIAASGSPDTDYLRDYEAGI